jgi:hypothetical protein
MAKVAYNACYGGFSLSDAAIKRYAEIKGVSAESFYDRDLERNDPALIQVIEELGRDADGECAKLRIVDLPAGTQYRIDEYDGSESVTTRDSYDWKTA